MKKLKSVDLQQNTIDAAVEITFFCNYACSYCWRTINQNTLTDEELTRELPLNDIRRVINMLNHLPSVHLRVTGGECTQHSHYTDVINTFIEEFLNSHEGHHLSVDTNFSLSLSDLKNHPTHERMGFLISAHNEYLSDGELTDYIDKIKHLNTIGITPTINLVLDCNKYDNIMAFASKLEDSGVLYNLHPHPMHNNHIGTNTIITGDYNMFSSLFEDSQKYEFVNGDVVETLTELDLFNRQMHQFADWVCRPTQIHFDTNGIIGDSCRRHEVNMWDVDEDYLKRYDFAPLRCPHNKCIYERKIKFLKVSFG